MDELRVSREPNTRVPLPPGEAGVRRPLALGIYEKLPIEVRLRVEELERQLWELRSDR